MGPEEYRVWQFAQMAANDLSSEANKEYVQVIYKDEHLQVRYAAVGNNIGHTAMCSKEDHQKEFLVQKKAIWAGMFWTGPNEKIKKINNHSGHWCPDKRYADKVYSKMGLEEANWKQYLVSPEAQQETQNLMYFEDDEWGSLDVEDESFLGNRLGIGSLWHNMMLQRGQIWLRWYSGKKQDGNGFEYNIAHTISDALLTAMASIIFGGCCCIIIITSVIGGFISGKVYQMRKDTPSRYKYDQVNVNEEQV